MHYNDIIEFWFQNVKDTDCIDKKSSPFNQWFRSSESFDFLIKDKFGSDLQKAQNEKYASWANEAKGSLALILLFDQFTRNIYRGTPQIYANDVRAQQIAIKSIEGKQDIQLQLVERVFVYMPLMHAEDANLQKLSVSKFTDLVTKSQEVNPQNTPYYEYHLKYAKQFCDQIEELGHFPHRK